MLDSIPGTWFLWSTLFHRARKKKGLKISTKSQRETFGKVLNNILWTTDDSAIGRINICGDPDSTTGRKEPKRKSPGATVLDKMKAVFLRPYLNLHRKFRFWGLFTRRLKSTLGKRRSICRELRVAVKPHYALRVATLFPSTQYNSWYNYSPQSHNQI